MVKILGLILFFFALCACQTARAPYESPLSIKDVTERQLETLIEEGKYTYAIQKISTLARMDASIPPATLSALQTKAADKLKGQFASALQEKDYEKLLSMYYTLKSLGLEDAISVTEYAIRVGYARQMIGKGETILGLHGFFDALSADDPADPEDMRLFYKTAVELGDVFSVKALEQYCISHNLAVPDGYAFDYQTKAKVDMLKGTVTIWVNKGIRIENGVGYPDRVIGSGFFIDKRGYIITNYHVIERSESGIRRIFEVIHTDVEIDRRKNPCESRGMG
jgi:serine protease Do